MKLLSLATAVPPASLSQEQAARIASPLCCGDVRQEKILANLYRKTGVMKRHAVVAPNGEGESGHSFYTVPQNGGRGPTTGERMVRFREEAGSLAHRAASEALTGSALKAGQITHLVTVSCSGFSAPGVDLQLVETLGLPPSTQRTNVGFMG